MHAQVQLVCLAPALAIASASKCVERSAALAPALLELLFFSAPSVATGSSFLSVAETPHELSLVLPEARLALFPPDALRVEPQRWRALQVASAGAGAFLSQLAVLTELTTQLARHGVSVFQISTYQTDYVLVKREDLATAVACLAAFCDVEMEDGDGDPELLSDGADLDATTIRQHAEDYVSSQDSDSDFAVHHHLLSVPAIDLFLVQIDKARVRRHVYSLVRLLFFSPSSQQPTEPRFLSYSATGDDVSVVTHDRAFVREMQSLAASGGEGVTVSPDAWKVVQVGDTNLGFQETGIVAGQTRVLLSSGTIVFYLSTFALDYMLIKEDEWPDALATLRRHFRVLEGRFAPLLEAETE